MCLEREEYLTFEVKFTGLVASRRALYVVNLRLALRSCRRGKGRWAFGDSQIAEHEEINGNKHARNENSYQDCV